MEKNFKKLPPLNLLPARTLLIYSAFLTVTIDELPVCFSKVDLLLITRFHPFLLTQGHCSSNILSLSCIINFLSLLEHSHQHKNMLLVLHCKKTKQNPLDCTTFQLLPFCLSSFHKNLLERSCWIFPTGSVLDPLLYFHLLPDDLIQSHDFKHSQIRISNPGFSQNSSLVYPTN